MSTLLSLLLLLLVPAAEARRSKAPAPPPPVAPPPPAELTAAEKALVDATKASATSPVRYVFLLDTAGAERETARAARLDIAAIVQALPAGDSIEVTAYHIRPKTVLPATPIDDTTRALLAEKVRSLDLDSPKDSDLGAALAYTTNLVTRSDAPASIYLFMLGSFCHRPSLASDPQAGGPGCHTIRGLDKLKEAVAQGRGDRLIAATLFPIGTPEFPVDEGGVKATESIFPGAVRVDTTATPFSVWAASYAHRVALERVAPLVRSDAERAALAVHVVTQPTAENPRAVVEITAGTRYLGARLSNLRVEGAATADFPAELDLTPTARLEVPFTVPGSGLSILPRTVTTDLPFTLSGDLTLVPAEGVQALGVAPTRPAQSVKATASVTHTTGFLGLIVLIFGLVVAGFGGLAGVAFLSRRSQRLRLGGSFSYRREGGPRRPLDIADLEEAFVGVGEDGELLAGKGRGAVLVLRMVRDRNGAYPEVEIFADGVEMNRKPVRRGRHRVSAGATSFQFGGYRLSWE